MLKRIFCAYLTLMLLMMCVLLRSAHASDSPAAHWQKASAWPDRIVVNPAENPATGFYVTWRTDDTVGTSIAQITPANDAARFDSVAITKRAKVESLNLESMPTPNGIHESVENGGLGKVHYHSVGFNDLAPNTQYAFRVQGARGKWSEWIYTKTAPEQGDIEFVYFGDSQNGVRSHWSRTIRAAYKQVPEANFFLHAGDLTNKGDSDYNWAEWFAAGSFIHATIPVIPVRGNHENVSVLRNGKKHGRVRTPIWSKQFSLPVDKSLPEHLRESNYQYRFGDLLTIFVVDSALTSEDFAAQASWLDEGLSKSSTRWNMVSMHHPFFLPEKFLRVKRDIARRKALMPVIEKHDVDLVMTGHVHSYMRSVDYLETTEDNNQPVKTVYTISASGAKFGAMNQGLKQLLTTGAKPGDKDGDFGGFANSRRDLERSGQNTPLFQVVRVAQDKLTFVAHTVSGARYDSFILSKDEQGKKYLQNQPEAYAETRTFNNTLPYKDWYDLK